LGAFLGALAGLAVTAAAGGLVVGSEFFTSSTAPVWAGVVFGAFTLSSAALCVVGAALERREQHARPRLTPQGVGLLEGFDQCLDRARTSLTELGAAGAAPGGFDAEVTSTTAALVAARAAALDALLELRRRKESSHVADSVFELDKGYRDVEALLEEARGLVTSLEARLKEVLLRQEEVLRASAVAPSALDAVRTARDDLARASEDLNASRELDAAAHAELESHLEVRRAERPGEHLDLA
jgi:hypothetical protein